ncbi:RlpA-like double-psi beta-barrel-protein domain-containing protein-containing protein [Phellopilus nigrolimitatus]|nr:RlpA-like double-psi beta-barrel-protein domain-containing protein-containing protein [Phellopilus nigrolimitatus]
MRFSTFFTASLFTAALPLAAMAGPVALDIPLVPTLPLNITGPLSTLLPVSDLEKRDSNARLTYYDITVGTTACGKNYKASDYVVALNGAEFGSGYPGPHCFKKISITANGKTATAQIVDKCPGCPKGGLDLTEGLFEHFAPTSKGVLTGSWKYV